jgi:hypothetical protein
MKVVLRLCALWACGPLALGASAAEVPAFGGSAVRNAVVAASPRHDSVTLSRSAALARSTADRLHSLLSTRARGRIAASPNRRPGPSPAAAGGSSAAPARELPGRSPQGQPKAPIATSFARILPSLPAATSAARVSPSPMPAAARGAILGGPRAPGPARLGGPAIRRTANNTGIDGTQIHRKY